MNGFKRYLIFYRNESATQTVELVRILPGAPSGIATMGPNVTSMRELLTERWAESR